MITGRTMSRVAALLACVLSAMTTTNALGVSLYGIDIEQNRLLQIDSTTGSTTTVGFLTAGGGPSKAFNGLAYDPTGNRFIAINPGFSQLFAVDRTTAATTLIGPAATYGHDNENGLAVDAAHGTAFISTNNLGRLLTVRLSDGVPVSTVSITGAREVEGLGYDARADILYGISQLDAHVVTINRDTGFATPLPTALPAAIWRGLEFDATTGLLYATAVAGNGSDLYRISPTTGSATRVGAIPGFVQSLAIVPEPGTLLLVVPALAHVLRRRHRATSGQRRSA